MATATGTPATDYLEEGGFAEEAKLLKRLAAVPLLWGIASKSGRLIDVAASTRRQAITELVDEAEEPERTRRWKIYRDRYGCRVVRIRIAEAD